MSLKFSDLNYLDVVFKQCPIHAELRYAGDKCPVCVAIEAYDLELGRLEEDKIHLEGTIADLESRLQGYKDELRL